MCLCVYSKYLHLYLSICPTIHPTRCLSFFFNYYFSSKNDIWFCNIFISKNSRAERSRHGHFLSNYWRFYLFLPVHYLLMCILMWYSIIQTIQFKTVITSQFLAQYSLLNDWESCLWEERELFRLRRLVFLSGQTLWLLCALFYKSCKVIDKIFIFL